VKVIVKAHRLHFLLKVRKSSGPLLENCENLMPTLSIFKWHAMQRAERGSGRMPPWKRGNDSMARPRPMYGLAPSAIRGLSFSSDEVIDRLFSPGEVDYRL